MTTRYPTTTHTAGTTYSRAGLYRLPVGTWSAAATVSTAAGAVVQTLDVNLSALSTPDADGHTHALSVLATAAQTALWPLAALLCDIRFTDASATPVIVPADTVILNVSAHTPPIIEADNPLQVLTPDMAPVLRGATGPTGAASTVPGPTGPAGPAGAGVPTGGTTGQVLAKASATDHDTAWVDPTGGGGTGATNLAYTASPTGGTVTSDTGTDAAIPLADVTNAGLLSPAQVAKLAATSGTNTGDQDLSGYATTGHTHTGTYDLAGTAASAVASHASASDPHGDRAFATDADAAVASAAAADATSKANAAAAASTPAAHAGAGGTAHANAVAGGAAGFISGADQSKLDGIAAGAQVNPASTDALPEGSTNLYSTAARIRATVLTGLSTAAGTVVAATHTILEAVGFLQKQVSDNTTAISNKAASGAIGSSGLTMATAKLLGRGTASTGAVEELTIGSGLTLSAGTLSASGGGGTPGGSTTQVQINDAGAFYGDSNFTYNKTTSKLTLNTGRKQLSITNDGNDPVIAADGTGPVHLWVKAGSQYLYLWGGNGAQISNNDINNYCNVSPSAANSSIRDASGAGNKRGIGLITYNVADLYISASGRAIANDTVATLNITGQASAAASTSNLVGGGINIIGGNGASSSSGLASGGSISISGGTGYGTGIKGIVTASRLRADGFATAIAAKTTSYTLTPDDSTVAADATSGAVTLTLPAVSGCAGRIYVLKRLNSGANAVTVAANAAETIDGANTVSLGSQYSTLIIQGNAAGTAWLTLAAI